MTEEEARTIVSTQDGRAGFLFLAAFENKTDVLKVMCMMSDRIRTLEQDLNKQLVHTDAAKGELQHLKKYVLPPLQRFKEREQEGLRAARRATELPYCPV